MRKRNVLLKDKLAVAVEKAIKKYIPKNVFETVETKVSKTDYTIKICNMEIWLINNKTGKTYRNILMYDDTLGDLAKELLWDEFLDKINEP